MNKQNGISIGLVVTIALALIGYISTIRDRIATNEKNIAVLQFNEKRIGDLEAWRLKMEDETKQWMRERLRRRGGTGE